MYMKMGIVSDGKVGGIKMYHNCCKKCGNTSLHAEVKGNNTGLYCDDCGAWIKWLSKDELRAFKHSLKENNKIDTVECEIPLGRLCCFKPLDKDTIYFGHMAGKIIDDFENMTFMYVLKIDDRYFFSRRVIITPNDVHNPNDAKRYF